MGATRIAASALGATLIVLCTVVTGGAPASAATCTSTPTAVGGGTVVTTTSDNCNNATGTGGGFTLNMGDADSVIFTNVLITAANSSSGFPDAVHLTGTYGSVVFNNAQLTGAPGGAALFVDFSSPAFHNLDMELNGGTYTAGTGGYAINAKIVATNGLDTFGIAAGTTVNGTVRLNTTGSSFGVPVFLTNRGTISAAGGDAIQVISTAAFIDVTLATGSVTTGNINYLAAPFEQGLEIEAGADTTGLTVSAAAGVNYGLLLRGTGSGTFDAAALLNAPDAIEALGGAAPNWTLLNFDAARFSAVPVFTDIGASLTLALPSAYTAQMAIHPGTSLTINVPNGQSVTASSIIDLRGTLNKDGDGALTLTGQIYDNSLSDPRGNINVLAGTLTLGNGDADEITFGDVTIGSAALVINSSYAVNSSGAITFNGMVGSLKSTNAGSTPFTYSGAITVTDPVASIILTGAHVISGDITVVRSSPFSAGRLDIHKQDAAPLTLSSNISGGGAFVVFGNGGSDTVTLSGDLSLGAPGNIGLGLAGATFNLTGDNSGLQGWLIIENGTLNVDNANDVGSAVLVSDQVLGTLNFAAGLTLTNGFRGVGALNVDSGTVTLTGHLEGFFAPGALLKTGNGTLVVSDVADETISVRGGTLELNGTVAGGALVSVATGATLDIHGDQTFGALGQVAGGSGGVDSGVVTNDGGSDSTLMVDYATAASPPTGSTFTGTIQNGTHAITLGLDNGTLILTGANTYTGGTNIGASGVLQIGDGSIAGSIATAGDMDDEGLFRLQNGTLTINGAISGGGEVEVAAGTLTLGGANSLSGFFTIDTGATLSLTSSAALGNGVARAANDSTLVLANGIDIPNTVAVDANSTLTVNVATGSARLSADFSGGPPPFGGIQSGGSGTSFTKTGAGVLSLDYLDVDTQVTVSEGTLKATGGDTTWTPQPLWTVASGATIDLNGSLQMIGPLSGAGTVTNTSSTDDATLIVSYFGGLAADSIFSGVIQDGSTHSTHVEVEDGALTLANANTYTGGTLVCACAVLQLGDGTSTGSIVGDVEVDGELRFVQPDIYSFGGAIDIEGGTVRILLGDITLSGNISNSVDDATIVVDGGSLTLSGDNSGLTNDLGLAAEVDVNNATLRLTRSESLGATADVFMAGGTVDIANGVTLGNNFFLESNTTTNFIVQTGSAHLAADCCVGGILTDDPTAGASTMIKDGAGTLVVDYLDVSGVDLGLGQPISGSVTVSAGTLLINGDGVIAGPADFTVELGATLDMQGSNGLGSLFGGGTITNGGATPVLMGVDYLFNADKQSTFDGVIEDGAQPQGISLAVDDGRLILRNTNTYTGLTIIGGLTCGCSSTTAVGLQLGDGTTAGSIVGPVGIFFGELDFNEPSATSFDGAIEMFTDGAIRVMAGDITLTGDLTSATPGDGAIFIDGGSLTLTGDNSGLSADFTVAGTLRMANLGSGTIHTVGTVLVYNDGDVVPNPVDINSNTTQFSIDSGTAEQQGAITETAGPRPMEKIGAGTLIVDSVAITGTTTITAGTLRGGATNAFSANSAVAVAAAGTLDLGGFDQEIQDLSGAGTALNDGFGGATLRINRANGGISEFDGTIHDGNGQLSLSVGPNVTTFGGALTYTGSTTLDVNASIVLSGDGTDLIGSFTMGSIDVLTMSSAGTVRIGGNITGDASVIIQEFGPGLFVLGGDNSGYDGTIVVGGGSLKVQTNTALGTQALTMSNATTLIYGDGVTIANAVVINSGTASFEVDNEDMAQQVGAILDGGAVHAGFTKTGAGTLTVNQLNNSGTTTVTQGRLLLGASNGLSANSVLSVSADGTLDMNGFSQLSPGIAGLEGSGFVTNSAGGPVTLQIDYSNSQFGPVVLTGSTFAGTITDTVGNPLSLEIQNGMLTLTGANTYTGQTVICDCGALQLGDGNSNTGSLSDSTTVVNNATLIFNRNGLYSAGFEIDDGLGHPGAVRQIGSGTTVLTNINSTYSGGTEINSGTLQIAAGTSGGKSPVGTGAVTFAGAGGVFQAGADFALANDFHLGTTGAIDTNGYTVTLDGMFQNAGVDPGVLTKAGSGTLVLTNAASTYTGSTVVNAGTLLFNGVNTNTAVQVNSGGTLGGGGTVGSITIGSGGALSPGNSIGTITAAGNVTLGGGGTYVVETDPTSADRVDAGGAVTLGGQLLVNFAIGAGTYTPHQYTIATGTSVAGAFSGVDSLGIPTGFVIGVSTTANQVFLDLDYADFVWGANPSTSNWFTGSNWQAGLSPSDAAGSQNVLFGNTAQPTVQINGAAVQEASLQFTVSSPSYSFEISGAATLTLDGLGIVDGANNQPTLAVSDAGLTFINSATAADAHITTQGFSTVAFRDQSSASSATFDGHGNSIISFNDQATAGSAIITVHDNVLVSFGDRSNGGSAAITASGSSVVQFIGVGPASDGKVTVGSIAGSGSFDLGSNQVTVGSTNASTEVSGSIAGAGSLVKVGTGTLTLSGAANYTGGTTIAGGTLLLGMGGTFASNVIDNAALAINWSDGSEFNRSISGSGTVSQISSGVLKLTGNNSYTGGTFVTGGTLATDGSSKLGTGTVTLTSGTLRADSSLTLANTFVLNGSGTFDTNGNNISVGGNVGGAALLVKEGFGALTLTGGANWTGGANVNRGTLIIAGSSIYSGDTAIGFGGATLIFNVAGTYTGNISGGGFVHKQGAGTLVFTGNALGAFTIEGGTLQIGNGGAAGTLAGNVTVDAGTTLAFNTTGSPSFNGVIDGAGGVRIMAGSLFMGLTQLYTGGTTIAAGAALTFGNGGVNGGLVGDVVDNGALTINRGNAVTLAGVMSGSGTLTKLGNGTLTLTGTSTLTGATAVNGGTLAVNGSIASSSVTVNNGGTLGGTGTVGSTTVASGGTIAAGNSIGTLNINGGLALLAGSITAVEINTSTADLIGASGAVSILGNLNVSAAAGAYLPHQYTLITATGSLTGTFGTLTGVAPTGFAYTVSTDAHNAYLNLIYKQFIWAANPGTTNWFTDANWTNGLAPPAAGGVDVFFDATAKPAIDLAASASVLSLQFTTATPSYTFNLAGAGTTLTLTGQGINDAVANAPSFNVGNGATMAFTNSAAASDARINVNAGGQLTFAGTSNAASAAITAQGTGLVNFAGTTGSANDNKVSAGSIAGSGQFNLGANQLTAGANNASTEVSGVIGGTGSLVKAGTGTLTLSGTNTFTGGLTVSAGTVQLGSGGATGSVVGAIVDNGTLAFNRSDNLAFGAVISGAGGVRQMGPGTLTLASSNTYTGATQVTGGTLSLTGSVTSIVTVSSGTLAGTGTMNGLTVASGATVSPGVGGVGTLTVNGATSFATGSTYAFDATTGVSDRITTSGAVNLGGGTLAVTVASGSYTVNSRITLVATSASLSGAFSGLTLNGSFGSNINPIFDYDATHAYLLLRPVAISTLLPPDASENVVDIAKAIDVAIQTPAGGNAFAPLANLNQADLVKVLEQMSGEVANGVPDGAFENLGAFLELLLDPANENRSGGNGPALSFVAPGDDRPSLSLAGPVAAVSPLRAEGGSAVFLRGPVSVWGALRGGWSSHGSDAALGTHPTNVSNGLMALGVDVRPEGQDLVLGAGAALGQVWWNVHPGLGSGHSNSQQFGVYGSKRFGPFYISMAAAFAQFQSNTVRIVIFGGTNAYQAHVHAQGQGLRAEAGYRFDGDGMGLTPYAVVQAQGITTSSYDEATLAGNPAFALHFPHQRETEVSSELGLAVDRVLSSANDNELSIEARVGWWHDYSDDISRSASLLGFPGTGFVVRGVSPPRDAAQLLLGLDAEISDGLSLKAKVQSLLGSNVQEYGGNLALKVQW